MHRALIALVLLGSAIHGEENYQTLTTADLKSGVVELIAKAYPDAPKEAAAAEIEKSLPAAILRAHVHTNATEDLAAMRAYIASRMAVFKTIGKNLDKFTALLVGAGLDNLDRRQLVVLMRLVARQDDEIADILAK